MITPSEYFHQLRPEPEPLKSIRKKAADCDREICIPWETASFLQWVIQSHRISTIVEMGTHYGYSAMAMAMALPEEGRIWTLEKDEVRASVAQSFFKKEKNTGSKINILEGDAKESLLTLGSSAPFDLVFIDANKNSYSHYLEWAATYLCKGGVLLADNVYLNRKVLETSFIEKRYTKMVSKMNDFNKSILGDERFVSTLLPVGDGILLATKK